MAELVILTRSELEELLRNVITEVIGPRPNNLTEKVESEKLNQKQAAVYLGITESTLIRWKKKGVVPYEQVQGSSKVFFYKSELKNAIQHRPQLLQAARN